VAKQGGKGVAHEIPMKKKEESKKGEDE